MDEIISDFELESIVTSLKKFNLESVGVCPEWRLQVENIESHKNINKSIINFKIIIFRLPH
jgi:hypothetical protein